MGDFAQTCVIVGSEIPLSFEDFDLPLIVKTFEDSNCIYIEGIIYIVGTKETFNQRVLE